MVFPGQFTGSWFSSWCSRGAIEEVHKSESTTYYFQKDTSEIKSERKYLVFYSNFFGRGHKRDICHFSSIASPSVRDTVQLYKSNSSMNYSLKLILLRQQIRKTEFRGRIMYHYDLIKHSPPQEYKRSAILSVGHDTGDECSKRLSLQDQTMLPYPLALTWGIMPKLVTQRSDKGESITDSSQISTLLYAQSFPGFSMDDY